MFWQAILFLLDFSFPKSMEVAVSINCNRFIFAGAKGGFWCIARFKGSTLTAILSFNINPLNVMLLSHRMRCFADPYINRTAFQIHKRQVLFSRRFGGVGNQRLHLLSAAHHRDARIVNKTDQITAMAANIKLFSHFSFTLIIFFTNFKIGLRMLTYRADFGSRRTYNDMSAITAFPNRYAGLFKYCFGFNIFKKCTVSFLM